MGGAKVEEVTDEEAERIKQQKDAAREAAMANAVEEEEASKVKRSKAGAHLKECDPDHDQAVRRKEEGNAHFKAGDYKQALEAYFTAILTAALGPLEKVACRSNSAMCLLKIAEEKNKAGDTGGAATMYKQVVSTIDRALTECKEGDASFAKLKQKMHYRRGLAYEAMQDREKARADFEASLQIEQGAEAQAALARVTA